VERKEGWSWKIRSWKQDRMGRKEKEGNKNKREKKERFRW